MIPKVDDRIMTWKESYVRDPDGSRRDLKDSPRDLCGQSSTADSWAWCGWEKRKQQLGEERRCLGIAVRAGYLDSSSGTYDDKFSRTIASSITDLDDIRNFHSSIQPFNRKLFVTVPHRPLSRNGYPGSFNGLDGVWNMIVRLSWVGYNIM